MNEAIQTWHQARGAEFAGSQVLHYGDVASEYAALRGGAGLVERGGWGLRRFTGAGRLEFLHKYCTQEVRIDPGGGAYGCCLNAKGSLLGDLWIFVREDDLLVVTPPAAGEGIYKHLGRFALFDDVEVHDLAGERILISVWGPQAAATLEAALGEAIAIEGSLGHRTLTRGEEEIFVARNDFVGVLGFDLILPLDSAPATLDALTGAGAIPVGEDAARTLRVEAGVPVFGVDMDAQTLPIEAGLEARAINYEKGCYLGQEVIARIKHRGRVNRNLRGLRLPEAVEAPAGLFVGPKEIGRLTSTAHSPSHGAIGLGLVHRKHGAEGTELAIGAEDGPKAIVCDLPFAR